VEVDAKDLNLPDLDKDQIQRGKEEFSNMSMSQMEHIIKSFKSMDPRMIE
jgi:hypothetical protein